jgi:glycosyltransferase involved in cell wall biosynthesis
MAARHLQVAQNVIFAGTQADLAPYLLSADAFLFTSHAESWGRAAVEAMAAGLPIVMTDVGLAGDGPSRERLWLHRRGQ